MPQKQFDPAALSGAHGAGNAIADGRRASDTTPSPQAPARRPTTFRYWRAADIGPTAREERILRRIAAGGLYVTHRSGDISRSFEDGAPVSRADFEKFVELRWIHPDADAPALIPGLAAQRYLVDARWLR